jgi:CheY-like chemotaxis protein
VNTSVLIFVVEDEGSIQLFLEDALAEGGYAVRFASSAEQAIAILDEVEADFRALITDVNLAPGKLTGWDVARHAREIREDIPVVYMTAGSAHEWSAQGVPKSLLLTKPFATAQVLTAVSQLINEQAAGL